MEYLEQSHQTLLENPGAESQKEMMQTRTNDLVAPSLRTRVGGDRLL